MSALIKNISTETHRPAFSFDSELSAEQKAYFEKNGFLHFKNFIPRELTAGLLREVESVEQYLLKSGKTKVNGIPLKFGYDHVRQQDFIQRIAFVSQYSDKLSSFLKDSRLAQLPVLLGGYEGRIGETEKDGLVFNHYLNSEESAFTQLGWHTDSPRDLFLGSRIKPMLNVGLHLDDCAAVNGGLRILPGTHHQSAFRLLFRKKYFIDNNPDADEIGFDIEAGDLTIHDGRTWHRVQRSPHAGEASRRRVMYIPVITGAYAPKKEDSRTPFYHTVGQVLFNRKKKPQVVYLSRPGYSQAQ